ncbi:MAG: hypothetical protein V1779_15175 [bacterium]
MTLEEQLRLFYLTNDITKIRSDILKRIELFNDKEYLNSFFYNLLREFEGYRQNLQYENIPQLELFKVNNISNINEFFEITPEFLKKLLSTKKYSINFFWVIMIEYIYFNVFPLNEQNDTRLVLNKEIELRNSKIKNKSNNLSNLFKSSESSDDSYSMLFAYTLRQTSITEIFAFLDYHHNEHKNIESDYQNFLNEILLDYDNIFLPKTKKKVEEWINKHIIIEDNKYPEFTQIRQALAMMFILDSLKIEPTNKKNITKFLQFFTKSNLSNLYDMVLKVYETPDNWQIDDLQYIRTKFEYIKADKIIAYIDNEIEENKKEK